MINVVDNEPPSITSCATNKILTTNTGCTAIMPDLTGEVTAADNVTPPANLSITQSPAAGTPLGIGTTPVTITVGDAAGNSETCTPKVTVQDNNQTMLNSCPS